MAIYYYNREKIICLTYLSRRLSRFVVNIVRMQPRIWQGPCGCPIPPNIKISQVPCTGRVDIVHLLKAIEDGTDGVYVAGCMEGDCHFVSGNLKARKRVEYVKKTLTELGIEPERVEMFNLSSAMGPRFAEIAIDMTDRIRKLGPSPVRRQPAAEAATE